MKKFIAILKKIWKGIWIVLSIVGALFIVFKIRQAIVGKVRQGKGVDFKAVPDEPDKIKLIKKDGSTEIVKLPDKVKFKDVVAAGITKVDEIVVEVAHVKENRKNAGDSDFVNDNAYDALRSGDIYSNDGG